MTAADGNQHEDDQGPFPSRLEVRARRLLHRSAGPEEQSAGQRQFAGNSARFASPLRRMNGENFPLGPGDFPDPGSNCIRSRTRNTRPRPDHPRGTRSATRSARPMSRRRPRSRVQRRRALTDACRFAVAGAGASRHDCGGSSNRDAATHPLTEHGRGAGLRARAPACDPRGPLPGLGADGRSRRAERAVAAHGRRHRADLRR